MTDFAAFKERQQQGWLTGDFGIIARTMVLVGELLWRPLISAWAAVLDVATGTGNTALAAARRGCEVIGLDYPPGTRAGTRRSRAVASHLREVRPSSTLSRCVFRCGPPRLVPCIPPTKLRQRELPGLPLRGKSA
jgi:SAM-dependent methyltransferase